MEVKISIVIPVYNVYAFLDKCLLSCVMQTFRDIEIIVIDDGSTDNSQQIIRKYMKQDERIILVDKQNEGLIYARKSGLEIACGEYIFNLDGDDYIPEDALEKLYTEACVKDADYVVGDFLRVEEDILVPARYEDNNWGDAGQDFLYFLLKNRKWSVCGKLIHKSLFKNLIYKQIFMGEDMYINMQLSLHVCKASHIHEYVYFYVQHKNSITKKGGLCGQVDLYISLIDSLYELMSVYPYELKIKNEAFLSLVWLWKYYMNNNIKEIKPALLKYYWYNKDFRKVKWKGKRHFYFQICLFLFFPEMLYFLIKKMNTGFKHFVKCLHQIKIKNTYS